MRCVLLYRIVEGHVVLDDKFDRECARVLAKRGVRQLKDGSYQLTRDRKVIPVRARWCCLVLCTRPHTKLEGSGKLG